MQARDHRALFYNYDTELIVEVTRFADDQQLRLFPVKSMYLFTYPNHNSLLWSALFFRKNTKLMQIKATHRNFPVNPQILMLSPDEEDEEE